MSTVYPTLLDENGAAALPDIPLSEEDEDSIIKSPKASGHTHKRVMFTTIRKTFKFTYSKLYLPYWYRLKAFYDLYPATEFYFAHPAEAYELELVWKTGETLVAGDIRHPVTPNGHSYIVTVGGTTTTEPSWSTTEGAIFTGGGVTWKENSYYVTFGAPIQREFDGLGHVKATVVLEET